MSPIFMVLSLALAGEMLTQHNDNRRWGANSGETELTVNKVSGGFGRLPLSFVVDGQIYAQPLVAAGAVFLATEANNVYSFDAKNGENDVMAYGRRGVGRASAGTAEGRWWGMP